MTKPQKFVDEILVGGDLYHVLGCGHVHPAVNTGYASTPAEEQDCEACGLDETVEALLKRGGKSEPN